MMIGKKWVCESKKSRLDGYLGNPVLSAIFRDEYRNTFVLKLDKEQFDSIELNSEIKVEIMMERVVNSVVESIRE